MNREYMISDERKAVLDAGPSANISPDRERELLAANNEYLERARRAEAACRRVTEERDRAIRRYDMWHAQCERQAVRLGLLHLHLDEMLVTFRPFRMKPVGAPGSAARADQDNQIRVHTEAATALRGDGFSAKIRDRAALDAYVLARQAGSRRSFEFGVDLLTGEVISTSPITTVDPAPRPVNDAELIDGIDPVYGDGRSLMVDP